MTTDTKEINNQGVKHFLNNDFEKAVFKKKTEAILKITSVSKNSSYEINI